MKKRCLLIFLLTVLSLACFAACNVTRNYDGQVKIIFELEGGEYSNCKLPVVHYYNVPQGQSTTISEMQALSKGDFTRTGYEFVGWYATKNGEGSYSDRWDFANDTVEAGKELTLYAKWEIPVKHTYELCYVDEETQQKVVIERIPAQQGETCNMTLVELKAKRSGYTVVDFFDSQGNLWDEDFTHPGGEQDLAVEIRVKYVKGDYTVVKSASDLGGSKNIYLARDVDMGGEELTLTSFTSGVFEGNGHTVSNFKIKYYAGKNDLVPGFDDREEDCLNVSLFGELKDAVIRNVTFDNYSVKVETTNSLTDRIYVSPLSGRIENCTFVNVKATNFSFTYGKLPDGFVGEDGSLNTDKYVAVTDRFAYLIDGKTNIDDDCKVTAAPSES